MANAEGKTIDDCIACDQGEYCADSQATTCDRGYVCLEATDDVKKYPAPGGFYVEITADLTTGED